MKIHKRIKIKWILLLVLVIFIALPLTAHAQSVTGQMSSVFGEVLEGLAKFLSVLLKVLQRILWPIFLAIGGLLNNDLLFGYGMEQRLLEVWVQMRNYVNIIFVVVLLGVALFNVLAFKPDSEFALKSFLPKFAIALIAVNFSYIAMKVVLDVTNVATIAVFTLPSSISETLGSTQLVTCATDGKCTENSESKKTIEKVCQQYYGTPKEYTDKLNKLTDDAPPNVDVAAIKSGMLCEVKSNSYTLSDAGINFFKQYNARNAGLVMAIQFMNVVAVDEVSSSISKDKVDFSGLTFNLLFSVILYIVYGAAYLALFIVLLARLVVLWLFIALSPFVALKFVVPNLMPESGGEIEKQFTKNAFAPVLMGIPLTIGYVILEALRGANLQNKVELGASFKMITIEASGISDLQTMIIAFAAVAVVWVGVFAAARGTVAEIATDFIKQKVKAMGGKAIEGLKLIPLIPAGQGGKGLSFAQAMALNKKPWESLKSRYGAQSIGPQKVTREELKRIQRSGTVGEAKTAIQEGIENRRLQPQIAALLQGWKTNATGAKKEFAERTLRRMGPELTKRLRKGKLSAAEARRIGNYRELQGGTPRTSPVASRTPVGTRTGTGSTASAQGANADITTMRDAEALGVAPSASLAATRQKWRDARVKNDKSGMQSAAEDLKNSDEVKRMRAIVKSSKTQLSSVQTTAKGLNVEKPDKTAIANLKKQLEAASKSMRKSVRDEGERKKILGQVLQKATGNKAGDLVKNAPDIAGLVTI